LAAQFIGFIQKERGFEREGLGRRGPADPELTR
jgi:hypothetical protein